MPHDGFPRIPAERGEDLHHVEWLDEADLVLFMAGNQFMVMPQLIEGFRRRYPDVRKIFYQTLPPGLALKQILADGALFKERLLRRPPDVYSSVNAAAMQQLVETLSSIGL